MTGLIRSQLTGLGRTIADLKDRVRVAVAGELGRAVSAAVRQVVEAVVAGRADRLLPASTPPYRRPASSGRWDDDDDRWGRTRDAWADDPDDEYDPSRDVTPTEGTDARHRDAPPADPGVSVAVVAGVAAARWWVGRKGTWLAAAGLGLGVGLLGVLGGPAARTTVAVLAATADMLAATELAAAKASMTVRYTAAAAVAVSVRTPAAVMPLRKILLVGTGVGLIVGATSYLCPHGASAAVSGACGAATAVAVQVGRFFSRSARSARRTLAGVEFADRLLAAVRDAVWSFPDLAAGQVSLAR